MNEYLVGDIVWAKLMGYPWWPAKVVDEKSLNKRVLAAKPKGSSTVWPVLFFGSFDYGWFGQENLCYFDEGLSEHGSLNRRGNLFARAVKQAQAPQSSEDSDESDEKPAKQSAKRSTRPGSQNVSKDPKRNASAAPKEKKAKIDKEPSDPASSDLSNSNHSSPVCRTQTKRSRPALSRSSKEAASNKVLKPVSEDLTEKVPEHSASETIVKSSPLPPKSPLFSKSPRPQHQNAKEEEQDVPEDVLEMRAIRASLQKATISGNYKNPELVDQILTTLENGVFSSQCLLAAKMAKLMRHLHSRPIPKNSYKFYERIRILGIRFKAAIESKSTDSVNGSKDSESTVQPPGKKLKSLSKNTKSSSIEPASDRDSETDNPQKKELDEAILNLLSESTEKDDNDDYSEKKVTKKLNSYNSRADSSSTSFKHVTENADSSGFLESANDSKELDNSKSEDLNENNSQKNHQNASKIIASQASSPNMDSTLEPIDDNDAANPNDALKPEFYQITSEIEKESANSPQNNDHDQGQQKVTLDENLCGESNLDNLSDSVPLSFKNVATEIELANNADSETISDKHEADLEKTSSAQTLKNISSTQNLDGVTELSEEQAISPSSSQNKDPESCSNQEQVSPDEAKVDIPHDAEKEASTVSPPSLASPVAERAPITAGSPSSRATVASL